MKNLEEMIHSESFYELEVHKTRYTQERRYIVMMDTTMFAERVLDRGRSLFQHTSTKDRECYFPENA